MDNPPSDGVIELDPGIPGYIVNGRPNLNTYDDHDEGLTISQFVRLTSSSPTTRATLVGGRDLFGRILRTATAVNGFVIENPSFNGLVDCVPNDPQSCGCVTNDPSCQPLVQPGTPQWADGGPWRKRRDDCHDEVPAQNRFAPGNLRLLGSDYTVKNIESKNALCATGLEVSGWRYTVENNYIASNGRSILAFPPTAIPGEPWADGITVLTCTDGTIRDNWLVDNTDIDLPVGGGRCTIIRNHIWHGGKYAFAGLNVGYFGNPDHTGSVFSGNTVENAVPNRLGMGLLVGSHPWSTDASISNAGIVGPSDVETRPNEIFGANINLIIEGAFDGTVLSNNPHNPTGSTPCGIPYNYTVYPPHAMASSQYSHNPEPDILQYDKQTLTCPAPPANLIKGRRGGAQ